MEEEEFELPPRLQWKRQAKITVAHDADFDRLGNAEGKRRLTLDEELARARSSDRLAELDVESEELIGTGTGSTRRGFLAIESLASVSDYHLPTTGISRIPSFATPGTTLRTLRRVRSSSSRTVENIRKATTGKIGTAGSTTIKSTILSRVYHPDIHPPINFCT